MASQSCCEFCFITVVSSARFGFVLTIHLLQYSNCVKTLLSRLNIKGSKPHRILNELNEEIVLNVFGIFLQVPEHRLRKLT